MQTYLHVLVLEGSVTAEGKRRKLLQSMPNGVLKTPTVLFRGLHQPIIDMHVILF